MRNKLSIVVTKKISPIRSSRIKQLPFFTRWLGVVILLSILTAPVALAQRVTYQYMQLFYYGPSTTAGGPIMLFSPAFKGKTAIYLTEPDEFTKLSDPAQSLSLEGGVQSGFAEVTTEKGTYINGKLQTPAQLQQLSKEAVAKEKAQFSAYKTMIAKHVDNLTTELNKAIGSAADDGWEIVQMASLEKSGLVYLFRKAK